MPEARAGQVEEAEPDGASQPVVVRLVRRLVGSKPCLQRRVVEGPGCGPAYPVKSNVNPGVLNVCAGVGKWVGRNAGSHGEPMNCMLDLSGKVVGEGRSCALLPQTRVKVNLTVCHQGFDKPVVSSKG